MLGLFAMYGRFCACLGALVVAWPHALPYSWWLKLVQRRILYLTRITLTATCRAKSVGNIMGITHTGFFIWRHESEPRIETEILLKCTVSMVRLIRIPFAAMRYIGACLSEIATLQDIEKDVPLLGTWWRKLSIVSSSKPWSMVRLVFQLVMPMIIPI